MHWWLHGSMISLPPHTVHLELMKQRPRANTLKLVPTSYPHADVDGFLRLFEYQHLLTVERDMPTKDGRAVQQMTKLNSDDGKIDLQKIIDTIIY